MSPGSGAITAIVSHLTRPRAGSSTATVHADYGPAMDGYDVVEYFTTLKEGDNGVKGSPE